MGDKPVGFRELGDYMRGRFGSKSGGPPVAVRTEAHERLKEETPAAEMDWQGFAESILRKPVLKGTENAVTRAISALTAGKFVVLIGAPGTGKTVLAEYICMKAAIFGAPGYRITTATGDWSTFETMGGYLPDAEDAGHLRFSPGLITESLQKGEWLVVDELNRADIDKALGELFTLFAGEKVQLVFREGDKPIVLLPPYKKGDSEKEFIIRQPADWRMIATMNTADKSSLFRLSYAFMRRFAFVEIPIPSEPDFDSIIDEFAAATFGEESKRQPVRTWVGFTKDVFSSPTGLGGIGIAIGPAIPLDILNYLSKRIALRPTPFEPEELGSVFTESLEMYLYPQFEGLQAKHSQIVALIRSKLSLAELATRTTAGNLASWTGVTL